MFSGILTLVFLLMFLGGSLWIWQPKLSASMRELAAMPLQEDESTQESER